MASFILAMVLAGLWSAYRGVFSLTREGEAQGKTYQLARAVMDILGRDMMALTPFRGKVDFSAESEARGGKDFATLSFSAKNRGNVWDEGVPAGINNVRYRVIEDREGRNHLLRETAPLPAGEGGKGQGFILCEELEALYLRFYDGENKTHDRWETAAPPGGKPGPLPRIVEVELHLKEGENKPPRRFSTSFLLPLAQEKP